MVYRTTYSKVGTKGRAMKADRFKLEERIMRSWATSDDIEDFVMRFYEGETRMTDDEVFNLVWGIKELHDTRMIALMDVFTRVFELDQYAPQHKKELRESIFNNQKEECND